MQTNQKQLATQKVEFTELGNSEMERIAGGNSSLQFSLTSTGGTTSLQGSSSGNSSFIFNGRSIPTGDFNYSF